MKKLVLLFALVFCIHAVSGCAAAASRRSEESPGAGGATTASAGQWTARQVAVIEGFKTPESVCVDPQTGAAYVSNIEAQNEAWWADDGLGFISRLSPGGKVDMMAWRESRPGDVINSPKGLCILGRDLYVTDNARLLRFSLLLGIPGQAIFVPGAERLNDLATDGKAVWMTDSATGKILRLDENGAREVMTLKSPNGITFHNGKMFGVSWDLHEIYELDPSGREEPKPFGLAEHFKNLDGIEVLDDGSFIVSDFMGDKVSIVSPDRRSARTLIEIQTPADIGLDRARGLLYVPQFMHDKVVVFQLDKK